MTTLREAALMALEALEHFRNTSSEARWYGFNHVIDFLRKALDADSMASLPEPAAWMTINPYGEEDDISYEDPTMDLLDGWTCKPLYTQPPQREWIGLTDAELEEFSNMQLGAYDLCDAVEERLEEKNRG